jgi:hypothetical protein
VSGEALNPLATFLHHAGLLTIRTSGATGTAVLNIRLADSGGTVNGGANFYGPLPLTIQVGP